MRIGCVPNSADLNHPGDRRKYLFYLRYNNIPFEIININNDYDIIYISLTPNLAKWINYIKLKLDDKKIFRIIFDLSDSYLASGYFSDKLRSLYYFSTGKSGIYRYSFKETILEMITLADVILCGSIEQKNELDKLHSDVIVIRDYFGQDIHKTKVSYNISTKNEINIFWEGFSSGNINTFHKLRDILSGVKDYKINLHIVTDLEYFNLGSFYLSRPTYVILKNIFLKSNVRFYLYSWNQITFSAIAASCDIALIPVPNDPIMLRKPENKLLLLWSTGLPVIASSIISYTRVMNSINQDFVCSTNEEWRNKIMYLISSQETREKYMLSANQYLTKHCSSDTLLKIWQDIFFPKIII